MPLPLYMILFTALVSCGYGKTAVPPTPLFNESKQGNPTPTLIPAPTITSTPPYGGFPNTPYIPEIGNSGYDVERYTLRLAVDPAEVYIQGTTIIQLTITQSDLTKLIFDFVGFTITDVQLNGQPLAFERVDGKLILQLPQTPSVGTTRTLLIRYEGPPVRQQSPYARYSDFLGLHFPDGSTIYAASEPDGARYWFPNNDHPRDKATYRFELQVPAGLTAVANGNLIGQQLSENGNLFIWEHNHPMASYLALIAVGPYQRFDDVSPEGIPLRHYILPNDNEAFTDVAAIIGEAIDWMSDLFGPYPFEAFGYVTAGISGISLENQTMVLMSSELIGKRTAVHEMAHMWFGNWVSMDDWSQMWLKEGYATYIQKMWEYRHDPTAFELEMDNVLSAVQQNSLQYPIGSPPPQHLMGYNTYLKGAAMLHALRQRIGDEAFFNGSRLFIERYGGKTATAADFQATMEETSGQSLDDFFAKWLR